VGNGIGNGVNLISCIIFAAMENIISKIRQTLIENADEKTRKQSEYFFKEQVTVYGVKSATVQKISKEIFAEIKDKPKLKFSLHVKNCGSRVTWKSRLLPVYGRKG
jgi:3-methyladenine DNA glycosylase AlkD